MVKLKSIRWRLPLSYAAIALLAALSLGVVLLTTLRGYYVQKELDYLTQNAQVMQMIASRMLRNDVPLQAMQAQFDSLSFLSRVHIRLRDSDRTLIVDSNSADNREVTIAYAAKVTQPAEQVSVPLNELNQSDYMSVIFIRAPFPDEASTQPIFPSVYETTADKDAIDVQIGQFVSAVDNVQIEQFNGTMDEDFLMPALPYDMSAGKMLVWQRSNQRVEMAVQGDDSKPIGYIELLDGPAYGSVILASVTYSWAIASTVAVVLAAGVGWLISHNISSPLLALTRVTVQMANGNLAVRADVKHHDEFGVLAQSFNEMAAWVENTVVTLRQFMGDAAHEIHTPLTALNTNLELAASERDEALRNAFIARACEQLKRLETLTTGLLDLSRLEMYLAKEAKHSVDLIRLIRETCELYASRADQAGITIGDVLPDAPLYAEVHEGQMRRVICNLLDNAIKFTPEEGTISIGIQRRGTQIEVWVQDTGIGIPAEDIPYLFNRFHRGRNAAAYPGSGLGLAIIKAIVENHGGKTSVSSGETGTRFSFQLPLSPERQ